MPKIVDFTPTAVTPAVTSPACGYTLSKTWAFATDTSNSNTIGYDNTFMSNSNGVLSINTVDPAKVGSYKILVTVSATDAQSTTYCSTTSFLASS